MGLAATCSLSVVRISTSSSIGSGYMWDTEGPHVVTNMHVADGSNLDSNLEVTLSDGISYEAKVVGNSRSQDISLLKLLDCYARLHPIDLGSSEGLYRMQSVYTMGFPLSCDMTDKRLQLCSGQIITTKGDANINPENSGGALFDKNSGSVIGVMVAANLSDSQTSTGIGYAIPVDTVKQVVQRLKQKQRGKEVSPFSFRSTLHVLQTLTDDHRAAAPRRQDICSSLQYGLPTLKDSREKSVSQIQV